MGQVLSSKTKTKVYTCNISVEDDEIRLLTTIENEPLTDIKVSECVSLPKDHQDWYIYKVKVRDGIAVSIRQVYPLF